MRELSQNLHENIVAICDVDENHISQARWHKGRGAGQAKTYTDFPIPPA